MANNIIQLASHYLTPDMVGKLAGVIGESSGATGSLVSAAVPMLLGGMASGSNPGGIEALASAMGPTGAAAPSMLDNLGVKLAALASGGAGPNGLVKSGTNLLQSLFGDKAGMMSNVLTAFSGTKASSASTILALLTPFLGGVMGKILAGAGQAATAGNVRSLLNDNKASALLALPPMLKARIAAIPGLGTMFGLPTAAAAKAAVAAPAAAGTGGFGRLLPWILAVLAIGLLAWWLLGRNKVDIATCNAEFKNALVGKTINFDTGEAVIAAESRQLLGELADVASRCQAYHIEIGGHTDTVGDAAMNRDLSQRRAEAVRAYLVGKGVPAGQLTAMGYGENRPLVNTGDEVPMETNRRIEFTVSK